MIMLMERPTRGQVVVDGQDLASINSRGIPRHRRNIGVVFQNHRLLLDRTVFDNVALPLVIAGYDHREVGRRARAALDKVGLLERERAMPVTLSGGEQQRVGIARAVVGRPRILLADEPTGNLDPALSAEIMQLFEEFNQVGVTVLIASHDLALISRMHHRIITLREGRLVAGSKAGSGAAIRFSPHLRCAGRAPARAAPACETCSGHGCATTASPPPTVCTV